MPPLVPRKRRYSTSPPPSATATTAKRRELSSIEKSKSSPNARPATRTNGANRKPTLEETKAYLENDDSDESSSSDDDDDSDEFEDVIPVEPADKRRKLSPTENKSKAALSKQAKDEDEDEDEDAMNWEETLNLDTTVTSNNAADDDEKGTGDLELTLDNLPTHTLASLTSQHNIQKGPSKIDRQKRLSTHCMHVQMLLFHNLVRNGWACDDEVQRALMEGCGGSVKQEVDHWRKSVGDATGEKDKVNDLADGTGGSGKRKGKNKRKGKEHKNQRDWGHNADHLEEGAPNLSKGDPTLRLLRFLASFWRKKFTITAPGFRKKGYKDAARLGQEVKSFRNDEHHHEEHGERIQGIKEFRNLARRCEGSRDVGAQLFTALLRGLGLEARLVCNLQPIGFGWSKNEEALPPKKNQDKKSSQSEGTVVEPLKIDPPSGASGVTFGPRQAKAGSAKSMTKSKTPPRKTRAGGQKEAPIDLSSDSELSSLPPSDSEASIIDVTPAKSTETSKRYDRDLPFPVYWTEVLSPITQTWIPVDPIVLSLVAGREDGLSSFEPRGSKADRAKQVMAYVVAFSSDGSAKDVTVRYLKRHMWPGKTKGVRFPVEKVPVYNSRGKIKRHEEYDWFKTVMSLYARSSQNRTAADDVEDGRELKPVKIVREGAKAGEETLQGYKTSAEFVLERHLRREEALLPGAEPVKTFTAGKGDKAKEEPVYRRKDVVSCKTAESWHKEGREVKDGEQALKHVPIRAVTLVRKREIEEAERESGEKAKQPLYSRDQTDWIIPPPIEDGVIPKNAFGNMDVYVPSMVPKGATHIPLRGTAKICKRLGIDFAEACTGFEFGNKRAVPVLTGVVVAKENEDAVIDAWEVDEEQKREREEGKREKLALGMWKKLLTGLQVVERVRQEYGEDADAHIEEAIHPMASKKKVKAGKAPAKKGKEVVSLDSDGDEMMGNGFFPEDKDTHSVHDNDETEEGGFIREEGAEMNDIDAAGGGFILEDDTTATSTSQKPQQTNTNLQTPVSLQSLHQSGISEKTVPSNNEPTTIRARPSSSKKSSSTARQNATSTAETRTKTPSKRKVQPTKKRHVPPSPSSSEDPPNGGANDPSSSSPLSDLTSSEKSKEEEDEEDEAPSPPKRARAGRGAQTPSQRQEQQGRSKRAAARRSSRAVRSHYFHDHDDDDEDEEDS